MEVILKIENLNARYDTNIALTDIDLEIGKGEFISVIGPNGSGKSTLFKSILNLVDYSGKVIFDSKDSKKLVNKIGYMPQTDNIDINFPITVKEVVEQSQLGKRSVKKHVQDAMRQVNVLSLADRNINELSGGQLQRVFLARTLAQDSDLLLLDEPFSNVDVTTQESIINLLKVLVQKGKTVMITTHDLKLAQEVSDKIILLNRHVVCYGDPKKVCSKEHLLETFGEHVIITSATGDITLSEHHHH